MANAYWENETFNPHNLPLAAQAEWRKLKKQVSSLYHRCRELEAENSNLRRKARDANGGITVIVDGSRAAAEAALGVKT